MVSRRVLLGEKAFLKSPGSFAGAFLFGIVGTMRVYRRKSIFGWKGDRGLGERLIRQILRGEKTATACPKALCSPAEIEQLRESVGHRLTVIDKAGLPRGAILQTEVFETRFGAPPPKLFRGEGFNTPEEFKQAHLHVWDDLLARSKMKLTNNTILLVEVFRLLGAPSR